MRKAVGNGGGGTAAPNGAPGHGSPDLRATVHTCAEEPRLAEGPAWINRHYQAILLEQQQVEAERQAEAVRRQAAAAGQVSPGPAAEPSAATTASQDRSPTSVR